MNRKVEVLKMILRECEKGLEDKPNEDFYVSIIRMRGSLSFIKGIVAEELRYEDTREQERNIQ